MPYRRRASSTKSTNSTGTMSDVALVEYAFGQAAEEAKQFILDHMSAMSAP
jgi:hypothetical protein